MQSTKLEFAFDLKTAKALGLTISQELLVTEVIERRCTVRERGCCMLRTAEYFCNRSRARTPHADCLLQNGNAAGSLCSVARILAPATMIWRAPLVTFTAFLPRGTAARPCRAKHGGPAQ